MTLFSWLIPVAVAAALGACGSHRTGHNEGDAGRDAAGDGDGAVLPDAVACTDECALEGQKGCLDDGLVTCGRFDADDCLEWSGVESCDEGLRCDPGTLTCREPCGDYCDPFSIVLLPDTQYYTSKQGNNASNTYRKQMQWILDHRASDAIQYVVHLGDITNDNTDAQWQIASDAHAMLDDADMPYSVVPGNHDYRVSGAFERSGSQMDDYFPPARFDGKAWYGGSYGASNTNNYGFFSVGFMPFLVISLEYAPRKDVLCWADDLISAHPDHRVILATHCYLTHGGGYSGGCPDATYDTTGASGVDVWEELVSRHSNLFLVVSGHVGDTEYRVKTSNTGAEVHEMLVDYQFEGECGASSVSQCTNDCRTGVYHGNGWMRQLVFDPRRNTVEARTFSVEAGNTTMFPQGQPAFFCSELFDPPDPSQTGGNWYASDPDSPQHQFEFAYDFVDPPSAGYDTLGVTAFIDRTMNRVGAGDQLAPVVAMLPDGSFVVAWEDDSSSADGAGNHDVFLRGFAAGGCESFPARMAHPDGAGHQANPRVAADAAGNLVVTWEDDSDGNGVFQIKAAGFDAAGQDRFGPITVNSVAEGQQLAPSIGMAPDGRFVVAWQDDPARDGNAQIWVRGFHADGTERFADRSAHDDVQGARLAPAVGVDAVAQFVVAWQDDTDGNGSFQIHARGFFADGSARFARITVNSAAAGQQVEPDIAVAADGSFVVVWRDDQDGDGDYQILGRAFHPTGSERIADFGLSASGGQHTAPAIAISPAGDFTMVWADDSDGNGTYQVVARSYLADGSLARDRWTVNRVASGQQLRPGIAENDLGSLVIVWEDDMDGNGSFQILGRGY